MNRRRILKALAGAALCPLCANIGFAAEGAHWSYEGAHGPDHWADLDTANKVCGFGDQQSPVAIDETIEAELPLLKIDWARQADTIVNNGHTIQLNFNEGGALSVGPEQYKLVQFHFHHPSEHLIDDKRFRMEAHFVHRNASDSLAVVGVLISAGKANAEFAELIKAIPASEGAPVKLESSIDPKALLPKKRGYYRYSGSLTTPPCSEIVDWFLLSDPIEVAESDIAAFAKLYPMNARPAQKLDRRFVLRSS
ncbi:carbonic anhydrase [Methylocapsa acidiphila]|uniref:carbonic anhydrase n=1 Tax=Methylocapsa acidiphila TaxID=133552 RepID=UPI000401D098|nr:carbonic anhydrase [Methylocapsa acidiphila]